MVAGSLAGRIGSIEPAAFEGEAFRHAAPAYAALSGEGARVHGGRWNPPNSFPVLYLATSRVSVVAEFYRLAERQGVPPENLLPRQVLRYRVALQRVLDLTNADNLDTAGLKLSDVRADDPAMCQGVGAAAHLAGFEAILAPSATSVGETLAVFLRHLQPGSDVEPVGKQRWNRLPPQ